MLSSSTDDERVTRRARATRRVHGSCVQTLRVRGAVL